MANTRTFFLYPRPDGTASVVGLEKYNTDKTTQKLFVDGHCNQNSTGANMLHCNAAIWDLGPSGSGEFYVRVRSIYGPSHLLVSASSNGTPVGLVGAQATIDSTGKSADVVRRLQVRVPLTPQYDYPEYALETTDTICKRLSTWPATSAGGSDSTYQTIPNYPLPDDPTKSINSGQNQNICDPAIL